jgi:DNA-binding response OmpR family regulator
MPAILLVDDDPAIGPPLARALRREDFHVTLVETGHDALEAAKRGVDLVLLDLGLPDVDGIDVCRELRASNDRVPVVILTARDEEADVVTGLGAGADDYITKPFRLAELIARVQVRLRHAQPRHLAEARGVTVDVSAHRAWLSDEELELTPKEFDLLALLVTEAGNIVSRRRLMHDIWDDSYFGTTRTLDTHISSLRKKLHDDPARPRLISTVRGVGFRFELN